MEFHEKLQALRKEKGLTQDELASVLYVSRAAISKWESGRGYPSIDSLKAISAYFRVSIDDLLSSGEILSIAEEDADNRTGYFRDLVFGCLDCSFAMFFFLPLFGQSVSGSVQDVSVIQLTAVQPWLRVSYLIAVVIMLAVGIVTFALQNHTQGFWSTRKRQLSLSCNVAATFLFILSRQPYAAAVTLLFLMIKVLILSKKR